jgi:hypothetical protein
VQNGKTEADQLFCILHSSLYTLHLNGVPSRNLASNLELRTLLLCALSYGDEEIFLTWLSVFSRPSSTAALTPENSHVLLLVQPPKEFLETSVGQNCFRRVERVPELVMTPSLVDEILTGMARRQDLGSAFTARHHVMSTRRDLPFTEGAF